MAPLRTLLAPSNHGIKTQKLPDMSMFLHTIPLHPTTEIQCRQMYQNLPLSHQISHPYITSKSRPYFNHLNLESIWKYFINFQHFKLWIFDAYSPSPFRLFPLFVSSFFDDKKCSLNRTKGRRHKKKREHFGKIPN